MKEKFVISIILPFFTNLFSFFANYILILKLQVELMDTWAFINSVITLGFLFADLGLNSIHYQFSSKPDYDKYFGTFLSLRVILIGMNTISTLILITLLDLWFTNFVPYMLIILITYIIIQLAEVFIRNLKSKNKIFKSEIPKFLALNINNIAILLLALNLSNIQEPLFFMSIINLLSNSFYAFLLVFISKKDLSFHKPKKELAKEYLKSAKPLMIYSILYIVSENIGNILLNETAKENSLAYFYIIYNYVIIMLLLISRSITDIYQVQYAHYFEKKDTESIQKLTHQIEKYSSIFFLSITIVVIVNAPLTFSIFLPNYLESVPLLYILIFVPYLSGISLPYSRQMTSGKRQKEQAIFDTFNRCLRLFLLFLLIPGQLLFFKGLGLGAIGYSLAVLIPWIFLSIGYRFLTFKYFKIKPQKKILIHLFISIFIIIGSIQLKNLFLAKIFNQDIFLLLISSGISIALFFIILVLIKEITIKDFRFFLELLSFKRYSNSFRDEFKED